MTRVLFLLEIEHQAALGLLAAQDLDRCAATGNSERLWYSAQAFLTATANLSKLLWGSKTSDASRRADLRELLGVSDDSPLRSRTLRNHFEHFDERIEAWSNRTSSSADLVIGAPRQADPYEEWRHFDPSSGTLSVAGDTLNLAAFVTALQKVKAAAELAKPSRWRPGGRSSE